MDIPTNLKSHSKKINYSKSHFRPKKRSLVAKMTGYLDCLDKIHKMGQINKMRVELSVGTGARYIHEIFLKIIASVLSENDFQMVLHSGAYCDINAM